MPTVSISIKSDLLFGLENTAKRTGLSKSKIMERALENYLLELQEDVEDAELAEKEWNAFVESREETIPADKLYKDLGF